MLPSFLKRSFYRMFFFYLIGKSLRIVLFFFQAEDGIRDHCVTGVQTCAFRSDADYFRALLRYATAQRAPAIVPQTLEWLAALDARDYPRAAELSDSLVAAATGDSPWLAADFLLDGVVMAKLGAGDSEGARRAFLVLTPRLRRAST